MSIFSSISLKKPKLNNFNLSFSNKFSTNMGVLTPVLLEETLPGDVFRHSHEIYAQFAPLNSQLMQRFDIQVHYFHVPTRLLWADFEKFLVGGVDGKTDYTPPYTTLDEAISTNLAQTGKLWDYLGLPALSGGAAFANIQNVRVSTLPFRAYQKVYNDFFLDENLGTEVAIPLTGGQETAGNLLKILALRNRAWKKDYFTSALPFSQKGDEVTLPSAGLADVYAITQQNTAMSYAANLEVNGSLPGANSNDFETELDTARAAYNHKDGADGGQFEVGGDKVNLIADLSNASIATIDEFRTAEMVQEWLEKNARGGTRYNENIYSHFGVRTPDSRLDRCEFIGMSSQPVTFGNVYSTNTNTDDNVQAEPVSVGKSAGNSKRWKYRVLEHGYILGIMSIVPKAAYFQGIPRHFSRMDKFSYYWPEFAHLGEQSIKNKEIYCKNDQTAPEGDFGYTPRFAEYKCHLDEIHGDYRGSLDFMHDARIFAAPPALNETFITVNQGNDSLTRVFNNINSANQKIWVDMFHDFKALRPMPYFGTPKFR